MKLFNNLCTPNKGYKKVRLVSCFTVSLNLLAGDPVCTNQV